MCETTRQSHVHSLQECCAKTATNAENLQECCAINVRDAEVTRTIYANAANGIFHRPVTPEAGQDSVPREECLRTSGGIRTLVCNLPSPAQRKTPTMVCWALRTVYYLALPVIKKFRR